LQDGVVVVLDVVEAVVVVAVVLVNDIVVVVAVVVVTVVAVVVVHVLVTVVSVDVELLVVSDVVWVVVGDVDGVVDPLYGVVVGVVVAQYSSSEPKVTTSAANAWHTFGLLMVNMCSSDVATARSTWKSFCPPVDTVHRRTAGSENNGLVRRMSNMRDLSSVSPFVSTTMCTFCARYPLKGATRLSNNASAASSNAAPRFDWVSIISPPAVRGGYTKPLSADITNDVFRRI
jgi:hypothetical protein